MTGLPLKTDVIDADAHVVESERVWDYLDASEQKYRPTLVASPDNPQRQIWMLDGENIGNKFPSPDEKQSEQHLKQFGREVGTPVEARELSDVKQRLRHMDELGIDVQVMFNSLWITPLTSRPDAEIALSWAWNRWLADVWKVGDNRLRWTCVVPALTPKEALPQIRFAKEHGAVGVCMRPFERERMMTDPYYYPIYDQAQRLDLPITVHLGNGSPELFKLMTNDAGGGFSTFRVPTVTSCYALIMSEIPRVFPKLRWDLSRCRANGCHGSFMKRCAARWVASGRFQKAACANTISTSRLRAMTTFLISSPMRARTISSSARTTATAIRRASSTPSRDSRR